MYPIHPISWNTSSRASAGSSVPHLSISSNSAASRAASSRNAASWAAASRASSSSGSGDLNKVGAWTPFVKINSFACCILGRSLAVSFCHTCRTVSSCAGTHRAPPSLSCSSSARASGVRCSRGVGKIKGLPPDQSDNSRSTLFLWYSESEHCCRLGLAQ